MSKLKIIDIASYIFYSLFAIVEIIFLILWSFDFRLYHLTIGLLIGFSFLSMVIIIIKLSISIMYEFKRFTIFMFVLPAIVGTFAYYLLKALGHFEEYYYLYWLMLVLIIPIEVVFYFLNKTPAKSSNGPKFIKNK